MVASPEEYFPWTVKGIEIQDVLKEADCFHPLAIAVQSEPLTKGLNLLLRQLADFPLTTQQFVNSNRQILPFHLEEVELARLPPYSGFDGMFLR